MCCIFCILVLQYVFQQTFCNICVHLYRMYIVLRSLLIKLLITYGFAASVLIETSVDPIAWEKCDVGLILLKRWITDSC